MRRVSLWEVLLAVSAVDAVVQLCTQLVSHLALPSPLPSPPLPSPHEIMASCGSSKQHVLCMPAGTASDCPPYFPLPPSPWPPRSDPAPRRAPSQAAPLRSRQSCSPMARARARGCSPTLSVECAHSRSLRRLRRWPRQPFWSWSVRKAELCISWARRAPRGRNGNGQRKMDGVACSVWFVLRRAIAV